MQVTITLNFPSIEAATEALGGLAFRAPTSVGVSAEEKTAAAAASTAVTRAKAKAKPEPVKAECVVYPEETPAPAPAPAPAVEYERDLKPLATKLIGINPEAFKAICANLGVTTFKALDPSRWGDALEATKDALAELEASV